MSALLKIPSARKPLLVAAVGIFACSCVVRLGFDFATGAYQNGAHALPASDRSAFEFVNIAESFARSGRLADPYSIPTGPTAHMPPVYPMLLGSVYRVFGPGVSGDIAAHSLNIFFVSLMYALLPLAAISLGVSMRSGVLAGLTGAIVPFHIITELRGGEYAMAGLCLVLLFLGTVWLERRGRFTFGLGLAYGAAWGAALLVFASFMTVFAGWLALLAIRIRKGSGGFIAGAALGVLFLLSPWAIRNWITLGSPVLLRDNFGLEMRVGNNDLAKGSMPENIETGIFAKYHPIKNKDEARRVAELGEVEYNRQELRFALGWIRQNPKPFVLLTLRRIYLFWFPKGWVPWQTTPLIFLLLISFGGWFPMAPKIGSFSLQMVIILWIAYPAVYYFLQTDSRYRYPVHWSVLLFAGVALEYWTLALLPKFTRWRPRSAKVYQSLS